MKSRALENIENLKRAEMERMLSLCTEEQQEFFRTKIFPNGPTAEQFDGAILLIERTLVKNGTEY